MGADDASEVDPGRVRRLLAEANEGCDGAWDRFFGLVFEDWCRLAHSRISGESPGHTLDTSALVNEAWLRLQNAGRLEFENTRHLHGAFSRAAERVLIDHARRRKSRKRGGDRRRVGLDSVDPAAEADTAALTDLESALRDFQALDPRAASVAIFRHCYGYSNEEVAEILQISVRTVHSDWRVAEAWLRRRLDELI